MTIKCNLKSDKMSKIDKKRYTLYYIKYILYYLKKRKWPNEVYLDKLWNKIRK